MKLYEADRALESSACGKRAFRTADLALVFAEDGTKLRSTIARLVKAGALQHVARDLYWYARADSPAVPAIEELAVALRPGEMNFIGMESAASLWNVISQIPVDRLTVVTTGKEGEFETPFGTIEFVHTSRDRTYLLDHTIDYPNHALRLATKEHTVRGLVRSGRSLDLVDWEETNADE